MFVMPLTVRFLPEFDVWFAFSHGSEQEGFRDMCAIPFSAGSPYLVYECRWPPGSFGLKLRFEKGSVFKAPAPPD